MPNGFHYEDSRKIYAQIETLFKSVFEVEFQQGRQQFRNAD